MPYDFYCPTIKKDLNRRICQICGLYFTSKKNVKTHKQNVHGKTVSAPKKIRPFRIVTKRGQELLVQKDKEAENVEWVDVDTIENPDVPNNDPQDCTMPQIDNLQSWMENPFEEE
ncbi:uncharacterized protein LOC117169744 [Belonocnema kinseyi]|uniref:uncharacterized protein LOC117169744 n=1 Tax=Belonocnema kinseyi TaxID=2817044 RepID=UPI00143D2D11|nr:uncharacterized protein LOC117169744 [Belonocnema kinseyi]